MRRVLLFSLALVLLRVSPAGAETLRLGPDSIESLLFGQTLFCRVSDSARYEWAEGLLIPREGFFSYYAEGGRPLTAQIAVDRQVARGRALRGTLLFPERIDSLEITLGRTDADYHARVQGFALDEAGRSWCFLAGIPSTAAQGRYSLRIQGRAGSRFFIYLDTTEVLHTAFRSEQIALNEPLSELMTRPDPRKWEEARQLRSLMSSFQVGSVFHSDRFQLPVQTTRRTSWFADRRLYSYSDGGSSSSLHNGIDLAAPEGTPVVACGAGRVVMAGQRIITGNTVVIEHLPGVFSLYFHLQSIEVEEGRRLSQGERIGAVGMTGLATGPHLHWEVQVSGVAVDPDSLVESPLVDKSLLSDHIKVQDSEERR